MGIPTTEQQEQQRGPPRLGLVHLWAIAVGSSIGGDFVGWNSSLQAGIGGAMIGLCVSTVLFLTLTLSIAEMAAHSGPGQVGGAHSFVAASPLGRFGAFVTGVAELLKLIPTGAAFALGIQEYLTYGLDHQATTTITKANKTSGGGSSSSAASVFHFGIWVVLYAFVSSLNMRGLQVSANAELMVTLASIAVLLVFYSLALPEIDFHRFALSEGGAYLKGGATTLFSSLPYSLEYFLGIESLPLLSGSARHPGRDIPRAIIYSMATLGVAAVLTLVLNSSVAPGADALQDSSAPLLDGFRALTRSPALLWAAATMISGGLIVGFHAFVLFTGETVSLLATDGILPVWLAALHPQHGTPQVALLASSALGLALLAVTAHLLSPAKAMSILINMAVFGALVSYQMQFLAYLSRPWAKKASPGFRSPLGKAGAGCGLLVSSLLLVSQLVHATQDRAEAEGLLVAAAIFAAALAAYWWRGGVLSRSRAAKAARSARTHADSLADPSQGSFADEEGGRYALPPPPSPTLPSSSLLAGAATKPQRRRVTGAGELLFGAAAGTAEWGAGGLHKANNKGEGALGYWCDV